MTLASKEKAAIFTEHGEGAEDTGSPTSQIALLTRRIKDLTAHLKDHPKDFATRRGLTILVGKRKRLQNYYKRNASPETYKQMLDALGLRK